MTHVTTLAIATSGPHGGLALQPASGELRTTPIAAGRGRGRDVMPALRRLLDEAGLEPADLNRLVVDIGPGSFTGVRVGVTVAKTLAWSLDVEVRAVSSLHLLAASGPEDAPVIAVRDAGRGSVYVRRPDGEVGRVRGDEVAPAAGDVIVGEDAAALAERFGWAGQALDVAPAAEELLAYDRAREGPLVAPHDLAPLYLQASAPERKAAGEVD